MLTLRRRYALGLLVLAPFAATACGGDDGETASGGGEGAAVEAVAIENPGVVTGTIAFTGTAPAAEPIDMAEEPVCAEKHPGGATRRPVMVNANGTLGNVFVYVKEGLARSFPTPAEAKTLDQDGCIYSPHVMGVQTGQTIDIRNSDGILHNINANPTANRGFNISQPTTMESERSFSTPEVMIPIRCDVHGWMEAYVAVLDHPYYAVSGEDGSFRIENLPPGDYVIEAWHERYGTQTQNVTVAPNGTADVQIQYSAAMAATAVVPLGEPVDLHAHHAPAAPGGERE